MKDRFLTLAAPGEAEIRVRGSRFLALARPVADEEVARFHLEERSRAFFDATHNCAAWRLLDGSWRAVDAGEPSGSAGAPILAALDARDLFDVLVVVTRYFGGTKLGIGGLVRAYGDAAAVALDVARKRWGIRGVRVRMRYPYGSTAPIMRGLDRFEADSVDHAYAGDRGEVTFNLAAGRLEEMRSVVLEDTGGAVDLEPLERVIFYRPTHV